MADEFDIFPWNDNFETGIDTIDAQHRRLVELLNQLVRHLAYQSDAPSLQAVFDDLRDYALVHFRDEEAIWAAELGDDPWVASHHRAHNAFVDEVLRIKAQEATRSLDDVIEEIAGFLTHWLALHIIDADRRLAKAVLARRAGLAPQAARDRADEEMAGATRVMIGTIMSMYDKLASRTVQLTREIARRKAAEARAQEAFEALARAKEEAVAANEAKSVYLANMSHEIRTPINAITGLVALLQREGVSGRQGERLQGIDDASQHLLRIINDILDLSKIEAGKLSLESVPLDLAQLMTSVQTMQGSRAAAKDLQLTVEPLPETGRLLGDPTRLTQALLNFTSNAVKFTERGSVTLRVCVQEAAADDTLLRFEVEDTGIGIAAEALPRLFASFEQAEAATARKFGGTGLGLAITRKLARLMGGEAGAHSVPGRGSTFWFTARLRHDLNQPVPAAEAPGIDAEARLRRHAGARVLLAEDNDINREIASELLADVGLVVEPAQDGQVALEHATARSYDLILMDMQMPRMDGLEATRRIRALPAHRRTPILAMTANTYAEDKARCLAAGMDDFITKPVMPDTLFATVAHWLGRGR